MRAPTSAPNRPPGSLRGPWTAGWTLLAVALVAWAAAEVWVLATTGANGGADLGPVWFIMETRHDQH